MVKVQGTRLFLFKQSNCSIKDDNSSFKLLFPNPATNIVNIEFEILLPTEIMLSSTDLYGKELNSIPFGYFNAGNNMIQYDCSKLPNGVYFLTLTGKSFKKTYQLVKI
jgi:hypothetical protein